MWYRTILPYFVLSGLLLSFSWIGAGNIPPLIFISLVPIFFLSNEILLQKKSLWLIFIPTCIAFLIWNIFTTYWIYFATPIGAILAILLNSLFSSCSYIFGVYICKKQYGRLHFLPIVASWIFWEFLHQHWDLSWTWLTLGNAFAPMPLLIQWYEWTGVLGGSIWILWVNFRLFRWLFTFKKKQFHITFFGIIIPVLISIFLFNYRKDEESNSKNPLNILIAQPNIDPYTEKFGVAGQDILVEKLTKIYKTHQKEKLDYIILPETALIDPLQIHMISDEEIQKKGLWEEDLLKSSKHLGEILELSKKYFPKAKILGGMDALSMGDSSDLKSPACHPLRFSNENLQKKYPCYRNHNAAFFWDGKKIDFYNKSKLVVGVELLPFENFLGPLLGDWIIDLGGTSGTLTISKTTKTFADQKYKIAPIICYESVYGSFTTQSAKNSDFIAIITNDAWWGNSPGHIQHQTYAQLRAIENRRWVVRSANTGISSVINPLGQTLESSNYDETIGLIAKIYPQNSTTLYQIWGDILGILAGLLLGLYLLVFGIKKSF